MLSFLGCLDIQVKNGDLESRLVWILNGQKEVGLPMVWIELDLSSGSPTI